MKDESTYQKAWKNQINVYLAQIDSILATLNSNCFFKVFTVYPKALEGRGL